MHNAFPVNTIRGELAVLVAVAVLAANVPPARCAEAPMATPAMRGIGPTRLIHNWPLHIAVAAAAAGLALLVTLGLALRRSHLIPPRLVKQLAELIDKGKYGQAIDLCESRSGCICRVVGAGLSEMRGGLDSMLSASRAARKKEFKVLRWRLASLFLVVILDEVAAIAAGLAGVYVPGVIFIAVILLTFLACVFFSMRVVELASEIEAAANGLLSRIRPTE